MARGRHVARVLRLLQMLGRPEGVTARAAAEELGCMRRTIYRDLDVIEQLQFPVYGDPDGSGGIWRVSDGSRWQRQVPFAETELAALWLARETLAALEGSAFASGARSALDKLRASLSATERRRLDQARQGLAVTATGRDYAARGTWAEMIRRAAAERCTVEIGHRGLDGRRNRRLLDPYLLWFDPSTSALYVVGWAHDRGEVRKFLLDRIVDVRPTGRLFERLSGWNAEEYVSEAFGAFHGDPTPVRLLFGGRAAGLVRERRWHKTQSLAERAGGAVEMAMRVPLSPALTGWVLSWMPEVKVLAPASLASDVRRALEEGLAGERADARRAVPRADTPRARASRARGQ